MASPFFFLLFYGVFTVIGGGMLGQVIRRARSGQLATGLFSAVIVGLVFSVMPLFMAWFAYSSVGADYLFIVQVVLLVATIGITALLPDEYLASLTAQPVVGAATGGFFFLLGSLIVALGAQERALPPLLMGGLFVLVGLGVAASAVVSFLRKRDVNP